MRPNSAIFRAALAAAIVFAIAGFARAQDSGKPATGKKDYENLCADCHSADGRGNGIAAREIPGVLPPDLTTLASRNGGAFPTAAVTDLIDGRKRIPSHERLAMPFWGVTMQRPGEEFSPNSNADVKRRIGAIVKYVRSLQRK